MTQGQQNSKSFTGHRRERKPRRSVRVIDRLARSIIIVGGIGSILAVSLVGVFLVVVAAPLFRSPESGEQMVLPGLADDSAAVLHTDEYRTMAWSWTPSGGFSVRNIQNGDVIEQIAAGVPTNAGVFASAGEHGDVVFGMDDGRVLLGQVEFSTEYLNDDEASPEAGMLDIGQSTSLRRGVVRRTPEGQLLLRELSVELATPVSVSDSPIRMIDISVRPSGPVIAVLDSAGIVHLRSVSTRRNLLTGKTTVKMVRGSFSLDFPCGGQPTWLMLDGQGSNLFVVWRDGTVLRYDTTRIKSPHLVETGDLIPDDSLTLTSLSFLVGKTSLVAGDSRGGVSIWFRINDASGFSTDGRSLIRAHELGGHASPAAVTSLVSSNRSRLLAVGYDDGAIRLYHVTNERLLLELFDGDEPISALALSPRDDALFASTATETRWTELHIPHPEATVGTLFDPIWYEGYSSPTHVWQSTGGTDEFEAKFGLMPLVVGTLKATFYSMLFGLPLALMAALTTSEFLKPSVKVRVKPAIEMMASLPSVVLGFLAALVFAPFLEDRVPQALSTVLTIPFSLLFGAHLWQLLPNDTAIRLERWKLPVMGGMLFLGLGMAQPLGTLIENIAFAGDIKNWLDGQVGSGFPGWIFLMLPLGALLTGLFLTRTLDPLLRRASRQWSRQRFVVVDLLKFLGAVVMTLLVAMAIGSVLHLLGFDPRGSLVGTYVQRNALIVGFVMGFAIIPIIYTIAEDALSAVPDHLRAASLGAGASPWQTAVRVVVPPAMSGLFSATMVGLGRAVGETMIVLMAAGNTPIMDMNIFNGFRTLAANIAVELPEAVQHSTHFRTLFLAALMLFTMTFVINTVAEIIRIRFRKKAYQL